MTTAIGSVSTSGAIARVRRCGRCGCRLSAYNSEEMCAACTRVVGGPPPDGPVRIPARVWADPDVQQALASFDFGRVSKLVRQRGSIRQEDLAKLTGLSQGFLSMLESGVRRLTSIDRIIDFLDGLAVPADLVKVPRRLPSTAVRPIAVPAATPGPEPQPVASTTADEAVAALTEAAIGASGSEGDADKTGPSATGETTGLAYYLRELAQAGPRPLVVGSPYGAQVPQDLLDKLQGTTDRLRSMDASFGSGSLVDLGTTHLNLVVGLLKRGRYDEATGRRLMAIAVEAASLAAWFHLDSGRNTTAQRLLLAALGAADASDDPRLGAGALAHLAIHAYSTGCPEDAVNAARTALERVKFLDAPQLRAMLLTRQARGHAILGQRHECLNALRLAADLCTSGRKADDPHWLYWMNEGEIYAQSGIAYLELGSYAQAVDSLRRAQGLLDPEHLRIRGAVTARLAIARLRMGDLDGAHADGARAVRLAETVQSVRLDSDLRRFAAMLRHTADGSASRAVDERVATLRAG